MRSSISVCLFFVGMAFLPLSEAVGQIMLFEGFESGVLAPWYNGADGCSGCMWTVTSADAHSGTYSAESPGNRELRIDFDPIPVSAIASASFWMRHPNYASAPSSLSFWYSDGTHRSAFVSTSSFEWERVDFTGWLDDPTKSLSGVTIWGYNGGTEPYITRVDDLEITGSTVTPEPVSLLLLGSGLAGVGGIGLRRRKNEGAEA